MFSYDIASPTSKYSIGICALPNNSIDNGGVIQQINGVSYVLGQLNQANLVGQG